MWYIKGQEGDKRYNAKNKIEEISFKSSDDAEEIIKNNMLSVSITYAIKPLQSFDSINITQSL